jgi:hypothetical protein
MATLTLDMSREVALRFGRGKGWRHIRHGRNDARKGGGRELSTNSQKSGEIGELESAVGSTTIRMRCSERKAGLELKSTASRCSCPERLERYRERKGKNQESPRKEICPAQDPDHFGAGPVLRPAGPFRLLKQAKWTPPVFAGLQCVRTLSGLPEASHKLTSRRRLIVIEPQSNNDLRSTGS